MVVVGRSCLAPFHLTIAPCLSEYLSCLASIAGLSWGGRTRIDTGFRIHDAGWALIALAVWLVVIIAAITQ